MSPRGARWLAKCEGKRTYLSGKPCKNGHTSERLTDTGTCLQCRRDRELFRYNNDEEYRNRQLKRRKKNPELRNKRMRDWRNSLPQDRLEKIRQKVREHSRKIRQERPKDRLFYSAKHRADKILRTPKWANLGKIKNIYKNCPKDKHVDHIVPLRAKFLSGLHVEYNLQYLDAFENLSKLNRYDPRFFCASEILEFQKRMEDFYV